MSSLRSANSAIGAREPEIRDSGPAAREGAAQVEDPRRRGPAREPGSAGQSSAAASPALAASPRRGGLWRHPLRFLRSRLRMLYGPPLSIHWGLDRGLPAHRYYLKLFMEEFRSDISGACLEFSDREYVDHFGGAAVTHCDVIDLDPANARATIIADITQPNETAGARYDCIICTHVLHVIPDLNAAVRGLHRILKPGGVLLCAVPMTSMNEEGMRELWRFTRIGLESILTPVFGAANVQTRAYGNSVIAAGEMRGLIADEFTWRELNTHDPRAAVEVCGRAMKKSSG